MNKNLLDRWISFEEFGSWFKVSIYDGQATLLETPMLIGGGMEISDGEIENVGEIDFCVLDPKDYVDVSKTINKIFNTNFPEE